MIYLLYGTDTIKSRTKLHSLIESMLKKKPDASHVRMTEEDFEPARLEELIGGAGLFSQKVIVELDTIFGNKDTKDKEKNKSKNVENKEYILEKIKELAESDNIFILLEAGLDKASLKKFEKHAEKIQEFSLPELGPAFNPKIKEFNIFSLTDALGKRDKKQLWVLYTKAKMKDVSDEEIHGILFWQVKAMAEARNAKDAKEAGLNPFVYQKSKGFLNNFSGKELEKISTMLVSIYHDARRGIVEFENALEKFIVEV